MPVKPGYQKGQRGKVFCGWQRAEGSGQILQLPYAFHGRFFCRKVHGERGCRKRYEHGYTEYNRYLQYAEVKQFQRYRGFQRLSVDNAAQDKRGDGG